MLNKHVANRTGRPSRNGLRTMAVVAACLLAMSECGGLSRAGTLYWDTDGSTAGNNFFSGANVGGSGNWNLADVSWWDGASSTLQVWSDGSDAVFWGTAGA